jgi:hypothetical protein
MACGGGRFFSFSTFVLSNQDLKLVDTLNDKVRLRALLWIHDDVRAWVACTTDLQAAMSWRVVMRLLS